MITKTQNYNLYISDSGISSDKAIIYCHGGAFRYGDKGDDEEFLSLLARKTSLPVYSVAFRNLDDARSIRYMIDDIKACMDLIHENDRINSFVLMGSSSGAYLAWILSIMLCNSEKYGISSEYKVSSVILISGYLVFEDNDGITNALGLFPSFQDFPKELKDVLMDYGDYGLPKHILLIAGEEDSCQDSEELFKIINRIDKDNYCYLCAHSDNESTEHCFLTKYPESKVSQGLFDRIKEYL